MCLLISIWLLTNVVLLSFICMILQKSTLSKPTNLITSINLVFLDFRVVYTTFSWSVNVYLVKVACKVQLEVEYELIWAWCMQFLHFATSLYIVSPVTIRLGYVYGYGYILDAITDT